MTHLNSIRHQSTEIPLKKEQSMFQVRGQILADGAKTPEYNFQLDIASSYGYEIPKDFLNIALLQILNLINKQTTDLHQEQQQCNWI